MPWSGASNRRRQQNWEKGQVAEKKTSPDRLIAAATRALQKGDGDFEMSTIARTAGVSVGLAYHYFGSKAGLIAAVVEHFYEALDNEVMMARLPVSDWLDRERLRIQYSVAFHYRHPLAAIILQRLRREPSVMAIEQQRLERQIEAGVGNMLQGQKQGSVSADLDPAAAATFTLAGSRALIARALALPPGQRPTEQALSEQIWNLIRQATRSEGS
ncbi:transcriptional regulator [Alcanivorax balearicus MACL04]|uniref:Transcriptional regulator n=1 Tax=Alloalcanivorax balearicus MACL04 TaxID=1177182 RepID=A0ABT2QT76_9GAMM|nr:transcriptional regulator [Alloalcanivorax balearicus MACL04]